MHILGITAGTGVDLPHWERVLASGLDAFMIREPALEAGELLAAARWVRLTAPDVRLWVNGRLDVALATPCGLHAPEAYPQVPPGLASLSRPIHDPDQVPDRSRAQQLILSPIFAVPGKAPAWGPARLHAILDALPPLDCRLLAMGGITPATLPQLQHPRLHGVALIRALWQSPDPAETIAQLRAAWS